MKDPNDTETLEEDKLDIKDDEIFEEEKPFDPYDEYGVSRSDFAWYGNNPGTIIK